MDLAQWETAMQTEFARLDCAPREVEGEEVGLWLTTLWDHLFTLGLPGPGGVPLR